MPDLGEIKEALDTHVFGDGVDGDVTISINTTLTETKFYNNLTINAGITLDGTSPQIIYVRNTLTVNGILNMDGKGGAGGAGGSPGAGGGGGINPGSGGPNIGGVGSVGGSGGAGGVATNLAIAGSIGASPTPGAGGVAPAGTGIGSGGGAGGGDVAGDGAVGGTTGGLGGAAAPATSRTIRAVFEYLSKDTRVNLLGAGGGGSGGGSGGGGGKGPTRYAERWVRNQCLQSKGSDGGRIQEKLTRTDGVGL